MALALTLLAALPVQAQQRLRVPEGATVVIPPRGEAPLPPPRTTTRPRPETEAWPDEGGGFGWGTVLVPLAAGAIAALATTLPGGRSPLGGGSGAVGGTGAATSGPVRTR